MLASNCGSIHLAELFCDSDEYKQFHQEDNRPADSPLK